MARLSLLSSAFVAAALLPGADSSVSLFGTGPGKLAIDSAGYISAFTRGLDNSATPAAFVHRLTSTASDYVFSARFDDLTPIDIAVDPVGSVYLAATTAAGFGVRGGAPLPALGALDIVILKLSSSGELEDSFTFGSPADDYPLSLAVDSFGAVYLTFNLGAPLAEVGAAGEHAIKLSPNFASISYLVNIGPGSSNIALDAHGNAYVSDGNTVALINPQGQIARRIETRVGPNGVLRVSPDGVLFTCNGSTVERVPTSESQGSHYSRHIPGFTCTDLALGTNELYAVGPTSCDTNQSSPNCVPDFIPVGAVHPLGNRALVRLWLPGPLSIFNATYLSNQVAEVNSVAVSPSGTVWSLGGNLLEPAPTSNSRLQYVAFRTSFPGPLIYVDNIPVTGDRPFYWLQSVTHFLRAPETQTVSGVTYEFTGWSQGGPATQQISLSDRSPSTFSAGFRTVNCSYHVWPDIQTVTTGLVAFGVETNPGCPWTYASSAAWITLRRTPFELPVRQGIGQGPGFAIFEVTPAPSPILVSANVTVANQSVQILQFADIPQIITPLAGQTVAAGAVSMTWVPTRDSIRYEYKVLRSDGATVATGSILGRENTVAQLNSPLAC